MSKTTIIGKVGIILKVLSNKCTNMDVKYDLDNMSAFIYIHKPRIDKEIEWNIIEPLVAETIKHTINFSIINTDLNMLGIKIYI